MMSHTMYYDEWIYTRGIEAYNMHKLRVTLIVACAIDAIALTEDYHSY